MRNFLKIVLIIIIALFLISGVFKIIGAAFSLTFGILGSVISFVWKLIFNPIVLIIAVAIIVYLAMKRRKAD